MQCGNPVRLPKRHHLSVTTATNVGFEKGDWKTKNPLSYQAILCITAEWHVSVFHILFFRFALVQASEGSQRELHQLRCFFSNWLFLSVHCSELMYSIHFLLFPTWNHFPAKALFSLQEIFFAEMQGVSMQMQSYSESLFICLISISGACSVSNCVKSNHKNSHFSKAKCNI